MACRIIKLLVALVYAGIVRVRSFATQLPGRGCRSPVVLNYHSVRSEQRVRFARQMDDLLLIAEPVTIDGLGRAQRHLCAVVTFDDAFQCLLENAIPELVARRIPAVIFVPSAALGRRPSWESENSDALWGETVMSSAQIRSLPDDLIAIGSHTKTHPDLGALTKEELREELVGSRDTLSAIAGRTIELLAIPYGRLTDDVLREAHEAGYTRVFSALPDHSDGFLSGRIDVTPDDWRLEFRLKVLGAYAWLPAAVRAKRRVGAWLGLGRTALRPTRSFPNSPH